MPVILSRKGGSSGGGPGSGVTSLNADGDPALTGAVVLSEGSGITLAQVGQDIEIAAVGGGGLFDAYAVLRHQVASGAEGGASAATTWNVRPLTHEVDPDGFVTLAANQVTLAAGSYYIEATSGIATPGSGAQKHQLRLRNITDNTSDIVGTSQYTNVLTGQINAYASLAGRITPAGAKTYELQHYTLQALAGEGLGTSADTGEVEIYAFLSIFREV